MYTFAPSTTRHRARLGRGCCRCWVGGGEWYRRPWLRRIGTAGVVTEEASSLGWGVGVEAMSKTMGNHVMVEPAQRGEVVGVVITAVGTLANVVGLKSVAAPTPVDGATTITPCDETADRWCDGTGPVRGSDGFPIHDSDELDPPSAQDPFQYTRSDSGSELDLGTSLTLTAVCQLSVNKHGRHRIGPLRGFSFGCWQF